MLEKLFWNGEDELKDLTTELVVRSAGWSTRVFNEEGIYLIDGFKGSTDLMIPFMASRKAFIERINA